jgi:anti-sigma B factor antagonist
MGIRRKISGSVTVLQVSGEYFGGEETDRLRKAILDEAASGNTRLLLDLADCSNMNSTALSVMVEAHRNYSARQGEIRLCGLQKKMTSLLVMTRLINVFGHYPTEVEALAAFAVSPADA